jgi:hypothetical protein
MNKGMLYILQNELVREVVMVHVHAPSVAAVDMSLFHRNIAMVNSEYPGIKMSALAVGVRIVLKLLLSLVFKWCVFSEACCL